MALDTLYGDFKDEKGLAESCRIARRDGFVGRIAIHPAQVATINECFTPTETDLAHARRVGRGVRGAADAGTLGIDGKMYDMPHLIAAKRGARLGRGGRHMSSLLANEFEPADDHAAIREGVRSVVTRFGDDYWLARDDDGKFPFEFHRAMADAAGSESPCRKNLAAPVLWG